MADAIGMLQFMNSLSSGMFKDSVLFYFCKVHVNPGNTNYVPLITKTLPFSPSCLFGFIGTLGYPIIKSGDVPRFFIKNTIYDINYADNTSTSSSYNLSLQYTVDGNNITIKTSVKMINTGTAYFPNLEFDGLFAALP